MTIHLTWHWVIFWLIVLDLTFSAFYILLRGLASRTLTYTPASGVAGFLEAAFVTWGVIWLATSR